MVCNPIKGNQFDQSGRLNNTVAAEPALPWDTLVVLSVGLVA
jgi:hypothetical protein